MSDMAYEDWEKQVRQARVRLSRLPENHQRALKDWVDDLNERTRLSSRSAPNFNPLTPEGQERAGAF